MTKRRQEKYIRHPENTSGNWDEFVKGFGHVDDDDDGQQHEKTSQGIDAPVHAHWLSLHSFAFVC